MSLTGKPPGGTVPTMPTGVEVASYATYLEAQKAVDHLSDKAFPVQFVTIVGTDLRLVERITGRLTYARVAGAGAMSGAWFGLMISLLYWIFTPTGEFPLLAGVLIGAAFGILFALVSYAFTGGKRDFTSASQVVASRYAVLCEPGHAGQAGQLLAEGGFRGRVRPPAVGTTPGPYGQQGPAGQPGPYGQQWPTAEPGRDASPADRPAPAQPEGAASPAPGEAAPKPSELGSRPDERPRYGLRLEDLDRPRDTDGDAPGRADSQG